jgi:hypothetical protein
VPMDMSAPATNKIAVPGKTKLTIIRDSPNATPNAPNATYSGRPACN